MSAILAGFGINTSGSPRRLAQRDTEAYWRRLLALGGTDINSNDEVQNVQEFLAGVYNLAPQSTAHIWALRSTQNVGTGAVAIPIIGGRDGVLTNGPTWQTTGIRSASGAARNVAATSVQQPAQCTMVVCGDDQQVSPGAGVPELAGLGLTAGKFGIANMSLGFMLRINRGINFTELFKRTGLFFGSGRFEEGNQSIVRHSTLGGRETGAGITTGFVPGAANFNMASSNGSGTGHIDQSLSMLIGGLVDHDTIYSLYKSTLGQGLGLP